MTPRHAPRSALLVAIIAAVIGVIVLLVLLRPGGAPAPGNGGPRVSNAPGSSPVETPPPHLKEQSQNAPANTPTGAGPRVPTPAGPNATTRSAGTPAMPNAPPPPAVNRSDLPPDHPPIEDEGAQVSIQWLGHACFYIHSPGGIGVVTDPFDPKSTGLPAPDTGAHLVTISSETADHDNPAVVHPFQDASGKLLPKQVVRGSEARLGDVRVVPIATVGGKTGTNRNYAYVIEAGPLRIAHLGALSRPLEPAQVRALGPIDVLLIGAGGDALPPRQAAELAQQLHPRLVIPMAFSTPDMQGPDAKLRPVQDFISATPFAVDRKEHDIIMLSKTSLPPDTEIWTLRYRE